MATSGPRYFGFVTGGQAANTVGLAAARHHVLAAAGWDVERDGLLGAPPIRVLLQAGNVNTGACDDLVTGCELAHGQGAWVHVDGAFGLWAAASPSTRQQWCGRSRGAVLSAGSTFRRVPDGVAGLTVVNDVVLNQVLVCHRDDARTDQVVEVVQRDGTCWLGGTTWRGRRAMRISVSNHSTTDDDVDRSVAAILAAAGRLERTAVTPRDVASPRTDCGR